MSELKKLSEQMKRLAYEIKEFKVQTDTLRPVVMEAVKVGEFKTAISTLHKLTNIVAEQVISSTDYLLSIGSEEAADYYRKKIEELQIRLFKIEETPKNINDIMIIGKEITEIENSITFLVSAVYNALRKIAKKLGF